MKEDTVEDCILFDQTVFPMIRELRLVLKAC
jgi:hypothetical protein